MDPRELTRAVTDAGLTLSVEGGKLIVRPAGKLTPELRAMLRANREAVIATIAADRLRHAITTGTLARGDTEDNRRQLLAEALALPVAQQLDLAEHFEEVARIWQAACRGLKA